MLVHWTIKFEIYKIVEHFPLLLAYIFVNEGMGRHVDFQMGTQCHHVYFGSTMDVQVTMYNWYSLIYWNFIVC